MIGHRMLGLSTAKKARRHRSRLNRQQAVRHVVGIKVAIAAGLLAGCFLPVGWDVAVGFAINQLWLWGTS